jgi:hypothetical protein
VKPTDAGRDSAFDRLIARGLEGESDASGNACPDADLLAAWYDRSLSASEVERIEAHASSCGACQQILADLARSEPEVVRAAPVPEPARPWLRHWRWLVPVATVLLVVVVVGSRTLRAPQPLTMAAREPAVQSVGVPEAPVPAPPASTASAPSADAPRDAQTAAKSAPATNAPAVPLTTAPPVEQKGLMARADRDTRETTMTGGGMGGRQQPAAEAPAAPLAAPVTAPSAPAKAVENFVGAAAAAKPGAATAADAAGRVEERVIVAPQQANAALAPGDARAGMRAVAMKAESKVTPVPPLPSITTSPAGNVAWRVGIAGRIERSTDGRRSWQSQPSGVLANLVSAFAVSDMACWVVGDDGVVLRTVDGATWQRVAAPASVDLVAVRATSPDAAVVQAADGAAYSTADGGKTWRRQ